MHDAQQAAAEAIKKKAGLSDAGAGFTQPDAMDDDGRSVFSDSTTYSDNHQRWKPKKGGGPGGRGRDGWAIPSESGSGGARGGAAFSDIASSVGGFAEDQFSQVRTNPSFLLCLP